MRNSNAAATHRYYDAQLFPAHFYGGTICDILFPGVYRSLGKVNQQRSQGNDDVRAAARTFLDSYTPTLGLAELLNDGQAQTAAAGVYIA
jgi:hypothetical protein